MTKQDVFLNCDYLLGEYAIKVLGFHQGICYTKDSGYPFEHLQPIPLTEKILLDSGFNYYENIAKYYHNDKCSISFAKGKVSRFDACTEKGTVILKDMQYVHELQNAYYMATGENLNIVIK